MSGAATKTVVTRPRRVVPVVVILRLLWTAIKGWSRDDVPRLGASLAYYALFSIAPILVIAIAIAGSFFGADVVRGHLVGQIDQLIGVEGGRAVQALLEGAAKSGSGPLAVVIGSVTFLIASIGAFLELQHALNTIFRVKSEPGSHVKAFVVARLRSFGLVLSIGFLLLVSLAVSAGLAALSAWVEAGTGGAQFLWQVVNIIVSLSVITVLFAMIYRFLPDVRLQWRDVWTGAFITAILFVIGKQVIGLYLGRSGVSSSYGAAGSVVVLLLWVYYTAQIVLLGAEFTRVYADREGTKPRAEEFAKPDPTAHPTAPGPTPAPAR
ncbi:MAG: YihY/virulence factor BrkB family protein [Gemmatimonadota bacterium]